ncbi:MAG: valine--tRNA ligase, partial [Candidatus Spechtbacteria bacterium]|nr:valine--tRNA ligase [Candidatus Spechtbacteria bacterium]
MSKAEELPKTYDPKATEQKIYNLWLESGFFNPDNLPKRHKKPFTILIPPPNVTGELHMGHALNTVIQDIIIRKKRMEGYKTLWLPGTDHAGIATQNKVEQKLRKEGTSRFDLGREKFIEEVLKWKEQYGNVILSQLKQMGASCDWSRTRFTMDAEYAKAVEAAFSHYYNKGWIYRGLRIVHWCVRCGTSLSDLELEHKEERGKLWFIKYPMKDAPPPQSPPYEGGEEWGGDNKSVQNRFITVATTRPETMLGDAAVAVNPKDIKYKDVVGKTVILPIQNREIPIIADDAVDPMFGTGAVKVTPLHDFNDWEIGLRHNLPQYKVINEMGRMTKESGVLCAGLKTQECRAKVLEELMRQNLIEKIEDYTHQVPHCYRCDSVIEPLASMQWFLKMGELAKVAMKAVRNGEVRFMPKKWEKVYFEWLKNVKDWCISRQLWWGHRIPIENSEDVLDTWFSSALWPFATLGWPDEKAKDLQFYPTQVLSTDRQIINLWVARMIFSSYEFLGKKPFSDVIIHATVLTKDGRRMSKSLGTGINPIELIEKYGADATRFGMAYQAMGGQDIKFAEEHIIAGRKFCNKLWNIARFVAMQTVGSNIQYTIYNIRTSADKKIFAKLNKTIKVADRYIEQYEFGHAAHALYDFVWHDFADIYIEKSKKQMQEAKSRKDADGTRKILLYVLSETLKLL